MVPRISSTGFIALLAFSYFLLLLVIGTRAWILREMAHDRSYQFLRLCHFCFITISLITLGICTFYSVRDRAAANQYENPELAAKNLFTVTLTKCLFVLGFMYITSMWILKGVFLGYFCRYTEFVSAGLKRFLHITSWFMAVSYVVHMLMQLTFCFPPQRNWSTKEDRCTAPPITPGLEIQVALDVFSDLLIFSIPIAIVRSIQTTRSDRSALLSTIVVGGMLPIITALRFAVYYESAVSGLMTPDLLRTLGVCMLLETIVGSTAFFLLPALRVWYRRRKGTFAGVVPGTKLSLRERIYVSRTATMQWVDPRNEPRGVEVTTWTPDWNEMVLERIDATEDNSAHD